MGLKVHMWNCKPLGITVDTPMMANWTKHAGTHMAKRRRVEYSRDQGAGDEGDIFYFYNGNWLYKVIWLHRHIGKLN